MLRRLVYHALTFTLLPLLPRWFVTSVLLLYILNGVFQEPPHRPDAACFDENCLLIVSEGVTTHDRDEHSLVVRCHVARELQRGTVEKKGATA